MAARSLYLESQRSVLAPTILRRIYETVEWSSAKKGHGEGLVKADTSETFLFVCRDIAAALEFC